MSTHIKARSRRVASSRWITSPLAGDIGEERKHIELEPLEVPVVVPVEEPVPA